MSYTNSRGGRLPELESYILDLTRYRHLCLNLVASDLRSRFRQSYLGVVWAVLQPLLFSLVVATVWGSVFQVDSYWQFAIYVFSGMLVWEMFTTSINVSLDTISSAQAYLRQARIPFLIFQLRVPLTGIVIYLFGVVGLIIMMLALGLFPMPGLHLLLLPIHLALMLALVAPLSIIFSIVGAYFRDARYVVGVSLQALFFLSPVMLQRDIIDRPGIEILQLINPLVPLLDMFRNPMIYGHTWELSSVGTLLAWIFGAWIVAALASINVGRRLVFAA